MGIIYVIKTGRRLTLFILLTRYQSKYKKKKGQQSGKRNSEKKEFGGRGRKTGRGVRESCRSAGGSGETTGELRTPRLDLIDRWEIRDIAFSFSFSSVLESFTSRNVLSFFLFYFYTKMSSDSNSLSKLFLKCSFYL